MTAPASRDSAARQMQDASIAMRGWQDREYRYISESKALAILDAALANERRVVLTEVENIVRRIPSSDNVIWWEPSNGPARRIHGMFAPLLAALSGPADPTEDTDGE